MSPEEVYILFLCTTTAISTRPPLHWIHCLPIDPFAVVKPKNPSIDSSEGHKFGQSLDFEALKLLKGR